MMMMMMMMMMVMMMMMIMMLMMMMINKTTMSAGKQLPLLKGDIGIGHPIHPIEGTLISIREVVCGLLVDYNVHG